MNDLRVRALVARNLRRAAERPTSHRTFRYLNSTSSNGTILSGAYLGNRVGYIIDLRHWEGAKNRDAASDTQQLCQEGSS